MGADQFPISNFTVKNKGATALKKLVRAKSVNLIVSALC